MQGKKEEREAMNVEIADRLAKRRREAGLSQEELAMRLGVSRQAVSKWERSESSPDTNNLIALARLYEVSLDDLLYVDGNIEEDVEFEIADRAPKESEPEDPTDGTQCNGCADASGQKETTAPDDTCDSENEDTAHTRINSDGIQFGDGDEYVNISWRDGINVVDRRKGEYVHVGWDGIHVVEGGLDSTEVTWTGEDGIIINGEHYDSWHDASCAYNSKKNFWLRVPYPILVLVTFFWLGFTVTGGWTVGLLLFLTIPLYYMVVNAFTKKRVATFVSTLYAMGATTWFLWMGYYERMWHPTWIIFFTIPLVSWLAYEIFSRKPKKG
jgi:HTH-type transcriptional regulator/antitoxin HipB